MAQQGKKIDDRTRAMIVTALSSGENAKNVARAFGVSETSVRRIRDKEVDMVALADEKRAAIAQTMDDYLEQERERAQGFISKALDYLSNEEKLAAATLSQIATAMGIVIDKWGKVQNLGGENESGVVLLAPVKDDEESGVVM